MKSREQGFEWNELRDIWVNSSETREIHIRMSDFLVEVKSKASPFEKDAIQSDLATLKNSWADYKGKISEYEKAAIKKDLSIISGLLKQFLNLFRKKS